MVDSILNGDLLSSEAKDVAVLSIPKFLTSNDDKDLDTAILNIANAFRRGNFSIFVQNCNIETEKKLIESFMKNVQLLVQKTWVEKCDEDFKEETLYRIENLCNRLIAEEKRLCYEDSFDECLSILHSVIMLLFGSVVDSENFLDYAFRIDPDFGFFCYYIERIANIENPSEKKARLSILLAMFFLANF